MAERRQRLPRRRRARSGSRRWNAGHRTRRGVGYDTGRSERAGCGQDSAPDPAPDAATPVPDAADCHLVCTFLDMGSPYVGVRRALHLLCNMHRRRSVHRDPGGWRPVPRDGGVRTMTGQELFTLADTVDTSLVIRIMASENKIHSSPGCFQSILRDRPDSSPTKTALGQHKKEDPHNMTATVTKPAEAAKIASTRVLLSQIPRLRRVEQHM